MNTVPLHVLKNDLARITGRVARGEIILVTKHNQPFVTLSPVSDSAVTTGPLFGKKDLKVSPVHGKAGKMALRYLAQDREQE